MAIFRSQSSLRTISSGEAFLSLTATLVPQMTLRLPGRAMTVVTPAARAGGMERSSKLKPSKARACGVTGLVASFPS